MDPHAKDKAMFAIVAMLLNEQNKVGIRCWNHQVYYLKLLQNIIDNINRA